MSAWLLAAWMPLLHTAPAGAAPFVSGGTTVAGARGVDLPALLAGKPFVHGIVLRDVRGDSTRVLAPGDTFFVDLSISHPSGFGEIPMVELILGYQRSSGVGQNAAAGAKFEWRPGDADPWVRTSAASTWNLLDDLCFADTSRTSTAPQRVRFAFTAGLIATASNSGEWLIDIWIPQAGDHYLYDLDMAERFMFVGASASAAFAPATSGAPDVALIDPPSGSVRIEFVTNTPWSLSGRALPLVGLTHAAARIAPGAGDSALTWVSSVAGSSQAGVLDSLHAPMLTDQLANRRETPLALELGLALDLPPGAPAQNYLGSLDLTLRTLSGADSATIMVPLGATVAAGGWAADSAVAEIQPQAVTAGTVAQRFTMSLWIALDAGATGVDEISIGLPADFGTPRIVEVRQWLTPVAFADSSRPGEAVARLTSRIAVTSPVTVTFDSDVPAAAAPQGLHLGVVLDDTSTPLGGTPATPGDANVLAPGSGTDVRIDPGPLARLALTPGAASVRADSSVRFSVFPQDVFGNPVTAEVAWRAEGGVGDVDDGGLFTPSAPGTGRVIAQSGAVAESAAVEVLVVSRLRLVARALPGVGGTLLPGGAAREVLRVRLSNLGTGPDTLRRLVLTNVALGPGSAPQLDASWTPLELRPGAAGGEPTGVPLATAAFTGGRATFDALELALAPGDSLELAVHGGASLAARDGDRLGAALAGPGDLDFSSSSAPEGDWPLVSGPVPAVDGMTAAQVRLETPAAGLPVGARRQPVLAIVVPANGYAGDELRRINLLQRGDATPGGDVPLVEAWLDDGDGAFSAATDALLGPMPWTGDRWEITGLSVAVPSGGRRVFVTADAAETAVQGRALRFALPDLPDPGLGMASGNSGPIDSIAAAPADVVISVADRITLAAVPLGDRAVHPGDADVTVLALDVRNTHTADRALRGLTVTSAVQGPGTAAQRDAQVPALELRADGDDDGRLGGTGVDPVLGAGVLVDGRAALDGAAWPLPAGVTRRLFVVARVSRVAAADGDRLAVSVASPLDLTVEPASVMAAAWPLGSTGAPVVDGMVAAQVAVPGAPGVTIGPGDGPVEVLDLVVPRNGYRDDVLTGLRVVQLGDAPASDFAALRLWRDGGDGRFDAGAGDDADLGPLSPFDGEWRSSILAEPLGAAGARLFVGVTLGAGIPDSATVRLAVPVGGITTTSGNGGPLDRPVENPDALLLSGAPLLAHVQLSPAASTPGQQVLARMTVRNVAAEAVNGIVPGLGSPEGDGALAWLAGPQPDAFDLAPGEERTVEWSLRAEAPGALRMTGTASGTGGASGLPRRALAARTSEHRVFLAADEVELFSVQSMPFAVSRGEAGVVPLSLTFSHPGGGGASDIRLDRFSVRLERQDGAPVPPAALLSRVAVSEGGTTYAERTSLESSGGVLSLELATPIVVGPGNPVTVALHLDIAATTTVPDFRVVLADSTAFVAADANSGAPIRVRLLGGTYPVISGLARVISGAVELAVASAAPDTTRGTAGQSGLRLAALRLANLSDPVTGGEVRVGALRSGGLDGGGALRNDLHRAFSRIRVRSLFGTHVDRAVTAADSTLVDLDFGHPLAVPAGTQVDLEVLADVRPDAAPGLIALVLEDSTALETRSTSTGDPVPARLSVAPLVAGVARIEARTDSVLAGGRPAFPEAASLGSAGVPALALGLRHPGPLAAGRVRLDTLRFELLDGARQRLAPALYLERVALMRGGAVAGALDVLPDTPAPVALPVTHGLLDPAAADSFLLVVDLRIAAPGTLLEIVSRREGLRVVDPNTGLAVAAVAAPGATEPLSSGVLRLEIPARRLAAGLASLVPALLPPDGASAEVARVDLANTAPVGAAGAVEVAHLRVVAEDLSGRVIPLGAVAREVSAIVAGKAWGAPAALAPDSAVATLAGAAPISIPAGGVAGIELRVCARPEASGVRFRFAVEQAGVGVVQPSNPLLAIAVEAAPGASFPLRTAVTSVAEAGLEASYANFPNPFAAGREPTTFTFVLERPARVTLRVWTLRGRLVRTLLDGADRGAGLHQSDRWDGRNGEGAPVANGTYVAELLVEGPGGPAARALRKVAVVR